MPLTFACAVCGWKYDPADFPARERPETFVPHHDGPRAALCLGSGGIALPVQARESGPLITPDPNIPDFDPARESLLVTGTFGPAGWDTEIVKVPRESEVCALCGNPPGDDGQRTADAIICGPCLSKHARPIPSRSVYTRESVAPPELGGEAG